MPIGIIINSLSIFFGGLLGGFLGERLKKSFCDRLTIIFGICGMSLGIVSIGKVSNMPPVILSVILGTILGEGLHLEERIMRGADKLKNPIAKIFHTDNLTDEEAFMTKFISILVLFCASGTGIFGSLQSGITGDHTILISKSMLDFFTAAIFAASLGYIVSLICIPQCLIFLVLFYSSTLIMPLTTECMLNDFTACGGILMLATGFRIMEIKRIPIANMLPAMLLVMPLSALWVQLF